MDHLARRALVLLAVLMLLPSAVGLIGNLFGEATRGLALDLGPAVPAATILGVIILVLFTAGLLVRLSHQVRRRDPFTGRLREVNERRARLAARYPAEDVPVHGERLVPEDSDPSLDWEEVN